MKRLFRWAFYAFIALVVCIVAGVLLLDTMAKSAAESHIRATTGMDVKIGSMSIGLFSPTLSIENFKLYNTAEFGGSPFLQMPELYMEYDRAMARRGQIHLKLVRIDVAEISIVQDKKGRYNYEALQKISTNTNTQGTNLPTQPSSGQKLGFTGIDTLNVTLQTARIGTVDSPAQDRVVKFGIKNQIFHDIKSEKDLTAIAIVLAARSGGALLDALQVKPPQPEAPPVQKPLKQPLQPK